MILNNTSILKADLAVGFPYFLSDLSQIWHVDRSWLEDEVITIWGLKVIGQGHRLYKL